MRTIIAQCTPVGSGSLAVIRLSGPASYAIADRIGHLASGKIISSQAANTIHYGQIIAHSANHTAITAEIVDHVMFAIMRAPRSFTGEDTVEISCHNNQLIITKIIDLALQAGADLAQRGEFSQQAFLNRKMDLTQAEALNELIHAQTAATLKKSLAQLDGSLSHWLIQIESKLSHALALTEASFEFLDEEFEFGLDIKAIIAETAEILENLQAQFSQDQQIRTGIKIAIIGPPNAGKSSLFNALLQQERAIVTAMPGTTRDTIEAGMKLDDVLVTFIDTAGLRQTDQVIEQLGIARSLAAAQAADVILLVIDGARSLTPQEALDYQQINHNYPQKTLFILNKCDLPAAQQPVLSTQTPLPVSAQYKTNLSQLNNLISAKIQVLMQHSATPFLLNQRHQTIIKALLQQLNPIKLQLYTTNIAYELLAINLNQALQIAAELSGKTISEQTMDQIFREFCVGK